MEDIKSAFEKVGGIGSETPERTDDVFATLKQEHRQVQNNLREILEANKPNQELFSQTVSALNAHMKGEEEVLYPKLEDNPQTRRLAFMAYEEHNIAKQLVSNLNISSTDFDRWISKITLLNNILNNHINMEENEIFPKAKETLYAQTDKNIKAEYLSHAQTTA